MITMKKNKGMMLLKKYGKLSAVMLFLSVSMLTYSFVFGKVVTSQYLHDLPKQTDQSVSSVFTISEYDGKIAVFSSENEQPLEVFERKIKDLPADDQKRLQEGITVLDKSQLQELIEDYTS